jgi:amino acid transporter
MLNEHVDFNNLYLIVSLAGFAFLAVMGIGFIYFTKLKKRDEEKRRRFKDVITEIDAND